MSDTFQRLRSALADRYVLDREIGAGGMATVYLAQDLRHRRPVALKVIRPELGGPQGVERFLREIELAARLQHPHILPVFDSGVVGGGAAAMPYFVMPFVEGETLRQRLEREGRLPPEDAVAIAGEIADALAYAHGHNVIHRDVKPENILLSGGHAVVADFGVAKAIEIGAAGERPAGGASSLTAVGLAIGTPHYMSPEQATGRDAVDARADQYSLGCVLYEMLVGRPPFTGETAQAVVAKAMTAPRPRPPVLGDVVTRALAADPATRYPDMAALAAALRERPGARIGRTSRRWVAAALALVLVASGAGAWLATRRGPGTVATAAETVAVLPFNASGPGVEFLGEGMVDLLATNLNGVGGIRTVDPRRVVHRWGDDGPAGGDAVQHALAVGRDLRAGSVVFGSAVSAGGRVRLAADIYSVAGDQLGRAQVDGPVDSVLPLVDRLSLALLRDVWRSREPVPTVRLAAVTTDSLQALRAYLRGEQHYRRLSFDSALAGFSRAVEVDSTFALAHFRRALAFGWTGGYGSEGSRQAAAAGLRFAHRLPPRDRRLLAHYSLFERGKPASVDSLRAFVAENPEDLEGRYLLGEALHHTRAFTGVSADTIIAAFDSVLARDSALAPAALHPLELALHRADRARFRRYEAIFESTAPPEQIVIVRALAGLVWGPAPRDSALRLSWRTSPGWTREALYSAYYRESVGSDTVMRLLRQAAALVGNSKEGEVFALAARGAALAGLGRLGESRAVADTLRSRAPAIAAGLLAWPLAMGLGDPARSPVPDSLYRAADPGPERSVISASRAVMQGDPAAAKREIDGALATGDRASLPQLWRGLLLGTRGWATLVEGDTLAGVRQLREGLDTAAAPGTEEHTAFLRFQLALALAGRPDTRREGIRRLRNSFELQPLFIPLSFLALGRAWEAEGQADSAAYAYGQFLRLWDKADPELQGRVTETREALRLITAEPRP